MKRFFICAFLFHGTIALAGGNELGNGGDAVVCRDRSQNILTIELLDLYEGRTILRMPPNLSPSLTVDQALQELTKRLYRLSNLRGELLRAHAKTFFHTNAEFLADKDFVKIPDIGSLHIQVPKGCAIEQIAIRRLRNLPNEALYIVNDDLWKKLDNVNRAALIFHEFMWDEFLEAGHRDSRMLRKFVALFTSRNGETLLLKDFLTTLIALRLPKTDIHSTLLLTKNCGTPPDLARACSYEELNENFGPMAADIELEEEFTIGYLAQTQKLRWGNWVANTSEPRERVFFQGYRVALFASRTLEKRLTCEMWTESTKKALCN